MLDGAPDLWLDGNLHRLAPGDGVAFPNGTGIAHCVLNNSDAPVRLIVVGERHADERVFFPVNPKRGGDGQTHRAGRRDHAAAARENLPNPTAERLVADRPIR